MNKFIKDILERQSNTDAKAELETLQEDIQVALGVIEGEYKCCPKCKDYYLTKSFVTETETHNAKICTWEDPINSGGNEYEDGYVDITYSICPKGHKREISRNERR